MEFDQLGWNAVTTGFIGTLVFNVVRVWGLLHQARSIWKHRSGKSVSVAAFIYGAGAYGCALTYGIYIRSAALVINGVLMLALCLPILLGLRRFKGFGRTDMVLGAVMIGLNMAMVALPQKSWVFLASSIGMMVAAWLTPWEIWRNKDAGVVEIRMLISGLLSSLFWTTYAFAIGDWALEVSNPIFLASLLVALSLWWRYHRPPRRASAAHTSRST